MALHTQKQADLKAPISKEEEDAAFAAIEQRQAARQARRNVANYTQDGQTLLQPLMLGTIQPDTAIALEFLNDVLHEAIHGNLIHGCADIIANPKTKEAYKQFECLLRTIPDYISEVIFPLEIDSEGRLFYNSLLTRPAILAEILKVLLASEPEHTLWRYTTVYTSSSYRENDSGYYTTEVTALTSFMSFTDDLKSFM